VRELKCGKDKAEENFVCHPELNEGIQTVLKELKFGIIINMTIDRRDDAFFHIDPFALTA
jgi:hypothetical protein